jgi:hypothetical protein
VPFATDCYGGNNNFAGVIQQTTVYDSAISSATVSGFVTTACSNTCAFCLTADGICPKDKNDPTLASYDFTDNNAW